MKFNLADLPPTMRAQVEKQIQENSKRCASPTGFAPEPQGLSSKEQSSVRQAMKDIADGSEKKHALERMNKTEAKFYKKLVEQQWDEIHFEAIKFRLADQTWYCPDFVTKDYDDEHYYVWEVKGFWRDDARVKIKVAADQYPMLKFTAVSWDSKAKDWKYELF